MKHVWLSLFFLLASIPVHAQQAEWEPLLHEIFDIEQIESADAEQLMEVLTDLEANPIDLNSATREDLEQITFLSEQQIEEIIEYVYKYDGMRTLNELSLIESLDYVHRQLLTFFVYVKEDEKKGFPKLSTIAKYGKHEFLATGKIPFYERRGDKNGYLGYPYRHSLKYTFNYGEYLKVGFIGAQDAGEPFFTDGNGAGYDHYSFYVQIKKLGRLKSFVAGRYRMKMGMGLVMNTDVGFGKTMTLSSLGRSANMLRGYSSRSSARYLQGAAATVELVRGLDLTGFFSYRSIDATLSKDNRSVQTILTDGYHRTPLEMAKKNNTRQLATGANISFRHKEWHVGVSGVYTHFNRQLKPIADPNNVSQSQRYRLHRPVGDSFWNVSADYGFMRPRFSIFGETALSDNHAMATINNINWQLSSEFSLVAVQRYFSEKYTTIYGRTFSEGGDVQNENGLYLGAQWQVGKHLLLSGYTDIVHFPFERYGVGASSTVWDNQLSATYSRGSLTIMGRYRIKSKEKNNDDKSALIADITQRGRLAVAWKGARWSLGTQADVVHDRYKTSEMGWMVSQSVGYSFRTLLQCHANIGYFHTDGYNSRIYTYEKNLLNTFSFPSFYGKGIRYAFMLRASLSSHLLTILKLGTTKYFDRDHISEGLQRIDHSSMTEAEVQVKWRF